MSRGNEARGRKKQQRVWLPVSGSPEGEGRCCWVRFRVWKGLDPKGLEYQAKKLNLLLWAVGRH